MRANAAAEWAGGTHGVPWRLARRPRARRHALPRPAASRPRSYHHCVNDDLDRIAPRESAHAKARDKKVRGPKVVAVNPGLKKLAQHLADKIRKKAKALRSLPAPGWRSLPVHVAINGALAEPHYP